MGKKDKAFSAVEIVHTALKPLKPEDRGRVLASVQALLQVSSATQVAAPRDDTSVRTGGLTTPARPLAIRELIQDKHPKNHPQFITLFAYYREKYQNLSTFSRDMLEKYYTDSRESTAGRTMTAISCRR